MAVLEKFKSINSGQLCLSIITFAELAYGVEKSGQKTKNRQIVQAFTDNLLIHPWDVQAATHYASARCFLEKKRESDWAARYDDRRPCNEYRRNDRNQQSA